jgi:filamentous hemagglutinin family protein
MERSWKRLFLLTFLCTFGLMTSAKAQITPDNSLGAETSTVGQPNQAINGIPINQIDQINGGARRGGNLFHSFGEFNVNAGRAAYFSNPDGVANILTRVTGVNGSNILGTLGVLGNANLFLINPNGIFFGANASLDVRGSFLGSSANSLLFDNGFEFSATNPQAPPLLTVNIPIGLRFRDNPGRIQVQRNGQGLRGTTDLIDTTDALRVQPNQTLALVGGDISLEGATLKTAGGRIELGSVAGEGLVSLTPTNNGFSLGYGSVQNFGNIQLAQQTAVDASGEGGGNIQVTGRRVTITDGSQIEASTLGSQPGGSLVVNAQELVELSGTFSDGQFPSALATVVYPGATGNAGDININAGSFSLLNGAQLQSVVASGGQGNGGSVSIGARESVSFTGENSGIFTSTSGRGNAGDIAIDVGSLSVTNGAQVLARNASGEGNAGSVTIKARDTVTLAGFDGNGDATVASDVARTEEGGLGVGNGNNLNIMARSVVIKDQAIVAASIINGRGQNGGFAQAGDVNITATDQVSVDNSEVFSEVGSNSRGNGGNINISAPFFSIDNGGLLGTNIRQGGEGNAGNINIKTESLSLNNGSQLVASTFGSRSVANAGNITVNSQNIELRDGGKIVAAAEGGDNAGNIDVTSDRITISVTDPTLNVRFNEVAQQFVELYTNEAVVQQESGIFVNSRGTGRGGNLSITGNTLNLDRGIINASTASGDGGSITLNLRNFLRLRNESLISTSAGGQQGGNGGNITINTPFIVAFPRNNDIIANAVSGSGGRVTTNATLFGIIPRTRADLDRLGVPDLNPRNLSTSDITAFSEQNSNFGDNVQVNSPDVDPSRGLVELPETVTDTTQKVAQSPCRQGFGNEFVVTGRGGLPTTPNEILGSDNVRVDLLQPVASSGNSRSATIKPATNPTATRVPAQGWIFNNKGQVVLTAYDPTNTGSQRPFSTAACPAR